MSIKPPTWKELPVGQHGAAQDRKLQLPTGTWRTSKPVYDAGICTRCRLCETLCPDGVITFTDTGLEIDYTYCKGCGICAYECPVDAITMERE